MYINRSSKTSLHDIYYILWYISCSCVYSLQFVYKICRFLLFKFWLLTNCFLLYRFTWYYGRWRRDMELFDLQQKKGKIWNFMKKSKFWKTPCFSQSLPFVNPFYSLCTRDHSKSTLFVFSTYYKLMWYLMLFQKTFYDVPKIKK